MKIHPLMLFGTSLVKIFLNNDKILLKICSIRLQKLGKNRLGLMLAKSAKTVLIIRFFTIIKKLLSQRAKTIEVGLLSF